MTREELNVKYCLDMFGPRPAPNFLEKHPVYLYEVTFQLKDGPKQKAYALSIGNNSWGAIDSVKEYQIPSQFHKYFMATARPVKKVYESAVDAPKNWYERNKKMKVKNLILPKKD